MYLGGISIMSKAMSFIRPIFFVLPLLVVTAKTLLFADASPSLSGLDSKTKGKSFTGRIIGNHVRMRTDADLESHVVREIDKGELLVIVGEKNDFYAVEPPSETSGYLFRSYIIDNVVEGTRVNVRLAPDREAPIIGSLNTGDAVEGLICEEKNKWMEIALPSNTHFYIAREFVEYAGKPELKLITEKRKTTVDQLLESAALLTQAELRKPFHEVDVDRLLGNYQTIIDDYSDFDDVVATAKQEYTSLQESYLHRKISFLESKTEALARNPSQLTATPYQLYDNSLSISDRMKMWEPVEESLYLSWSAMHHAKTMDDFYVDQKLKATTITGILEEFSDPIKMKPGSHILKDRDVPVAYIYSTQVNLHELEGKQVSLTVYSRPNNSFAFPAYYVFDAE